MYKKNARMAFAMRANPLKVAETPGSKRCVANAFEMDKLWALNWPRAHLLSNVEVQPDTHCKKVNTWADARVILHF
jgi:hypothetical protein